MRSKAAKQLKKLSNKKSDKVKVGIMVTVPGPYKYNCDQSSVVYLLQINHCSI